ncbi:hypothetical protein AOLI_G00242170 [Acnodon oligacanthus]
MEAQALSASPKGGLDQNGKSLAVSRREETGTGVERLGSAQCLLPSASVLGRRQVYGGSGSFGQKLPRPDLKPAQREVLIKMGSPWQSAGEKKRGRGWNDWEALSAFYPRPAS